MPPSLTVNNPLSVSGRLWQMFPRCLAGPPPLRQQNGPVRAQVWRQHSLLQGGQGVYPGLDGGLGQSLLPRVQLRPDDLPAGQFSISLP